MLKKFFFGILAFLFLLPLTPLNARVCGLDKQNYDNAEAAEEAGVEVAYNFACVTPTSEDGLYEAKEDVNFVGALIEVGSTDVPTTLIIRKNGTNEDYTVSVSADTVLGQRRDQYTKLSDWIPGDQIRVIGKINKNTGTVEATVLLNLSIKVVSNRGANGWITKIDKENKIITYQWQNKEHKIAYNDDTRIVAGLKNPATVDDLQINDRIRGRLLVRNGETPLAKIIIVLRRGSDLFMKIRTFRPYVTLTRVDSSVIPTTIEVRVDKTPGLRKGDVNNLIGTEGTILTINVTENTRIVRKYFGNAGLEELSVGDKLMIVGRVNDDGTVDAKLIKDKSIWKTNTRGQVGVVKEINTDEDYLMVDWTPIKHLTKKQLKNKIKNVKNRVNAQSLSLLSSKAGTKIKIGKYARKIKKKKNKINRIRHRGLKLKDLIQRGKTRTIKVQITDDTKIIIGGDDDADISDIEVGDKIRTRGIYDSVEKVFRAETIVVVPSLPEIDYDLNMDLDNINEEVTVIDVSDDGVDIDLDNDDVDQDAGANTSLDVNVDDDSVDVSNDTLNLSVGDDGVSVENDSLNLDISDNSLDLSL